MHYIICEYCMFWSIDLCRLEVVLESIVKLQAPWCKISGILQWNWLQMTMMRLGGLRTLYQYPFLIFFYFLKTAGDISVRIPWRCLLREEKLADLYLIRLSAHPVCSLSRLKMEKEGCTDFYVVSFLSVNHYCEIKLRF